MTSILYYFVMNKSAKHPESTSEIKRQRTANKNIVTAMALLLVALIIGGGTVTPPNGQLTIRAIIWGIFAVIAFASLLIALFIAYKQSDERQQLVQLQATSLTCTAVIFSLVSAQILHALDIVDLQIALQVIVAGAIVLWMSLIKVSKAKGA